MDCVCPLPYVAIPKPLDTSLFLKCRKKYGLSIVGLFSKSILLQRNSQGKTFRNFFYYKFHSSLMLIDSLC